MSCPFSPSSGRAHLLYTHHPFPFVHHYHLHFGVAEIFAPDHMHRMAFFGIPWRPYTPAISYRTLSTTYDLGRGCVRSNVSHITCIYFAGVLSRLAILTVLIM
jgi:hypothetical protein